MLENRQPYAIFQRVIKSDEIPKGLKRVSFEDINIDEPIIFCFGGNGAISDRLSSGMGKVAEGLLGVKAQDDFVKVYSVRYGVYEDEFVGNLTTDEVEEIAKGLFINRLVDAQGQMYSYEDMLRHMRNLQLLTFSFGAKALKCAIDYTAQFMEYNLWLEEEQIHEVLGQILHIAFAPTIKSSEFVTNFEIKSLQDGVMKYADEFHKNEGVNIDRYKIKKSGKKLTLYVEKLSDMEFCEEHDIALIKRDENWMTHDKNSNAVSRIMAETLSMGVVDAKRNCQADVFVSLNCDMLFDMISDEVERSRNVRMVTQPSKSAKASREIDD